MKAEDRQMPAPTMRMADTKRIEAICAGNCIRVQRQRNFNFLIMGQEIGAATIENRDSY